MDSTFSVELVQHTKKLELVLRIDGFNEAKDVAVKTIQQCSWLTQSDAVELQIEHYHR